MAKESATQHHSAPGGRVVVRTSTIKGGAKVKFGSVTVSGAKPSRAAVEASVKRSTTALERITKKLIKPGVVIRSKKDVPQFSADEQEPGVFVRRLNGRVERGRLINGSFQVLD